MKKIFWISGLMIGSLVIVAFSYGYMKYKAIEKGVEDIQITFDDVKSDEVKTLEKDESILFLLLGIGDRPGDPGRADSIICVSVNQSEESILMFNIPRDTKTEIIGEEFEDKINHAYAFGRTEMMKNTVEHFIDQQVDHVIQVNMDGMRRIVDVFGGIEVENEFAFTQADELGEKTYHFDEGLITLDGEKALHYSRMRKQDPRGDMGRNARQRQVLQTLVHKASSLSTLTKIDDILDVMEDTMKTNVTFEEMKHYAKYIQSWKDYNLETVEINGEHQMIDGIYYYHVADEERKQIAHKLKGHLQLSYSEK